MMPTEFKGATGQKDSAGRLQEDHLPGPDGKALPPLQPWQEVGRGAAGEWGRGDRRKQGAKASPLSPPKRPKANGAGQGRTFKGKVRFGVLVII